MSAGVVLLFVLLQWLVVVAVVAANYPSGLPSTPGKRELAGMRQARKADRRRRDPDRFRRALTRLECRRHLAVERMGAQLGRLCMRLQRMAQAVALMIQ